MNIVRMGVNGGLHELRGGCGRRRYVASHTSSSAARDSQPISTRAAEEDVWLQITDSNEPVQITNIKLK